MSDNTFDLWDTDRTDKADLFDSFDLPNFGNSDKSDKSDKTDKADLFDLLGTKQSAATVNKKPTNLEVLAATQDLIDKLIAVVQVEKEMKQMQAEVEKTKAEIKKEAATIQQMVENYDPSFDAGMYAILPENLNVRQLQRIAELHQNLSAQGYSVRLLRYSHSSENNWIAWKPSLLKGNISIEIITRKIETDEYYRTSFDVFGTLAESADLNLLTIELEGITFDEMDQAKLAQDPRLITLISNTQDCQQKTNMRHPGIRLIVPTPLTPKIVFTMVENDIEQVEAQVISAMTDPLKHLNLS